MSFQVVDVSDWQVLSQEPGGAESKDWITPPESVSSESRADWWLYKPVKVGRTSTYRRHDDVAERVASALAGLLGLPAAQVELAHNDGAPGVISRNVTPDGWTMHGGDVMLSVIPGYLSCQGDDRPKDRVGHSLPNIERILADVQGPPGPCSDWTGFEVFSGYLVFDAWIANTDRHAMNWALLDGGTSRRLAPTFDHGSALASGIADDRLLRIRPLEFCRGGRASRFEGSRNIQLVDLALEAVKQAGPRSAEWIDRLKQLPEAAVPNILGDIPGLSYPRRTFMMEVLGENRRRLTQ